MDTSEQHVKMCDCPEIQEKVDHWSGFRTSERRRVVWLPRQDQLQEMLANFNLYYTVQVFRNWVVSDAFKQNAK